MKSTDQKDQIVEERGSSLSEYHGTDKALSSVSGLNKSVCRPCDSYHSLPASPAEVHPLEELVSIPEVLLHDVNDGRRYRSMSSTPVITSMSHKLSRSIDSLDDCIEVVRVGNSTQQPNRASIGGSPSLTSVYSAFDSPHSKLDDENGGLFYKPRGNVDKPRKEWSFENFNCNEFSRAEIALHNKEDDCWLIVENKVYDVTQFVPEHPGGRHAFHKFGGIDVDRHFIFHSPEAQAQWRKFQIGVVEGTSKSACVIM